MAITTQIFSSSAIPTIEEALLAMAEYITTTITPTTISGQEYILQAIQQTLLNMIHIIDAGQIQTLMAQEYSLITRIPVGAMGLSTSDQTLVNNRLASFNSLVNNIYPLPTWIPFTVSNLGQGQPALQFYDLISYYMQFNAETPPVGLTYANFNTNASAMANAWNNVVTFLATNGTAYQVTAYDPCDRMYFCSLDTANFVTNMTFATNTALPISQAWNSLIALPSLLRVSSLLFNDPSSQTSQSINVLKFLIFSLLFQTNALLTSFNVPSNIVQPAASALRSNESLMDFAARTTGDYSNWVIIAQANSLLPPYIGTVPGPNVATPGQQLYLPPYSNTNLPVSDYATAYLGTDWDFGLPGANNNTLIVWFGDFSLISGTNNLLGALYRRILTPLGSLIYHQLYGSQIPAQAGNITTVSEATLLSSFLRTCLLSDPRIQSVNQITAYPVNFGQIVLTANVTPFGSNTVIPLNLVLVPQQTSVTKT